MELACRGGEGEGVGGDGAVEREGGAGDGSAAEWAEVHAGAGVGEAGEVALEHGDVGEEPVGEEDGLGALEVRVAGHDGVACWASAWVRSASTQSRRPRVVASMASRTKRRMSVAICSLRERPVWSLRARAPISLVSSSSTKWWMSSACGAEATMAAPIWALDVS